MMKPGDLPETIPLFPLPGVLLLPRARLPLHVFEPRYLAMLEDALKTPGRLIGMIQPRPAGKAGRRLAAIGCAGRVTGFSETEDGRYMITLTGVSRFRLLREVAGFAPYLRGEVGWDDFARDRGPSEQDPGLVRADFIALLARFFAARDLAADWDSLKEAEDEMLVNSLAMLCPFEPEDRQALLEAPTLQARRETLMTLMDFALRAGDEDKMQ